VWVPRLAGLSLGIHAFAPNSLVSALDVVRESVIPPNNTAEGSQRWPILMN